MQRNKAALLAVLAGPYGVTNESLDVKVRATIAFGTERARNGSVSKLTIVRSG